MCLKCGNRFSKPDRIYVPYCPSCDSDIIILLESFETRRDEENKMSIVKKARKTISIEDGRHTGDIIKVAPNENSEFKYIDVTITIDDLKKEDGSPVTLRYGCPDQEKVTLNSKLGRLLTAVNFDLKNAISEDIEFDIEMILLEAKLTYMTVTEETEKGSFARIVPASIKLQK